MTYQPTDAEVEALAIKMEQSYIDGSWTKCCAAYTLRNYELCTNDQRCDGSGTLWDPHGHESFECGLCPNCAPPQATPTSGVSERTLIPGTEAEGWYNRGWSDGQADQKVVPPAAPVSIAYGGNTTAVPFQLIAPNPVLSGGEVVPLLIELGPATLRALMAAIIPLTPAQVDYVDRHGPTSGMTSVIKLDEADLLLAALDKEPKP